MCELHLNDMPLYDPMYTLQPKDVGLNHVVQSARRGILVSEHGDFANVGESFISFKTKGGGGCALHAVWGHPDARSGEFTISCDQMFARQECSNMLDTTLHSMLQRLGSSQALEDIVTFFRVEFDMAFLQHGSFNPDWDGSESLPPVALSDKCDIEYELPQTIAKASSSLPGRSGFCRG